MLKSNTKGMEIADLGRVKVSHDEPFSYDDPSWFSGRSSFGHQSTAAAPQPIVCACARAFQRGMVDLNRKPTSLDPNVT